MLILIMVLVALAAGFVAGGSLRGFERVQIHWWGAALTGAAIQLVPSFSLGGQPMGPVLLATTYSLLTAFLWVNRRLPAAPLMLIGLVLNLLAVVPNGGMPVSASALESAGGVDSILSRMDDGKHHLMTDDDVLTPLTDVIAVPPPVGAVLSIGDAFLYAGLMSFVVLIMLGRSGENRRPPARWFQGYRGKHLPPEQRLPRQSRARPARSPAAAALEGSGP
ncbi:MAG: DUF5317 family protein [Actinomycetota bacterium]